MTVLESIQLSTDFLLKKGIESARLNAELLLANILNCRRMDLYLSFDKPLRKEEVDKYRDYIARRGKYEPLQYITGETEFYGMKFKVNPSVLIPRPETEILVETVINNINPEEKINILDIGCGSGNIAVTLAKKLPNVSVTTIDISLNAIELAKENAKIHDVEAKINFMQLDILSDTAAGLLKEFDLIVSNPPYVSEEEYKNLQNEVRMYEPKSAVTDTKNGYAFYEKITSLSEKLLKKNGMLFFEIGFGQSDKINLLFNKTQFDDVKTIKDYQSIERIVFGVKK